MADRPPERPKPEPSGIDDIPVWTRRGVVLGIPGVILAVPVALLVKSTLATLYGDEAA